MSTLRRSLTVGMVVALAGACLSQPQYRVTDIGPFGPLAIGQNGMAAGGSSKAYAWDATHGLMPIPGLNTIQAREARDVNAFGQVVGYDFYMEGQTAYIRSYVWDPGAGTREFADFGTYQNGIKVQSQAYGINDLGQIVGMYDRDGGQLFGSSFLYTPGQGWVTLPRYHENKGTVALQINNRGEIIGNSLEGGQGSVPILWRPDGSIEYLGHLLNQYQNFVEDINDLGYIAGGTFGPLGNVGYVRSPEGVYTPIWNPYVREGYVSAFGINDSNVVVGSLFTYQGGHGFVLMPEGKPVILNELLDSASQGWFIRSAYGINASGQICGVGVFGGQIRGVVLDPVPEPATLLSFAFGVAWLSASRRQARSRPNLHQTVQCIKP